MDCSPPGSFCPWNLPGKNTGVGCHSFSRGSCQTRDWSRVSWVFCIGKQIIYHCTTWKANNTESNVNHVSWPKKPKHETNRSNVVTNSVKTLKIVHIEKNIFRKRWFTNNTEPNINHLFLKIFFLMWTIFKVYVEFVTILLLFHVWCFGHKIYGVLVPRPGIGPAPSALKVKS